MAGLRFQTVMGKIQLTVQRLKGSRGSSRRSSSQSAGGLKKSDSGASSKGKAKHSKSELHKHEPFIRNSLTVADDKPCVHEGVATSIFGGQLFGS